MDVTIVIPLKKFFARRIQTLKDNVSKPARGPTVSGGVRISRKTLNLVNRESISVDIKPKIDGSDCVTIKSVFRKRAYVGRKNDSMTMNMKGETIGTYLMGIWIIEIFEFLSLKIFFDRTAIRLTS